MHRGGTKSVIYEKAKCLQIHSAIFQPDLEAVARRAQAHSTLGVFVPNPKRGRQGQRTAPDNTRKFVVLVDTTAQATILGSLAQNTT